MTKRSSLIVAFVLLLAIPAWAEDRRIDTTKLVIMTLNGEFLWDGVELEITS